MCATRWLSSVGAMGESANRERRWPAIVLLALLSPATAEISIGDLPYTPDGLVALIFFLPIYGGGAVLLRELAVRRRAGLAGLFVLGLAYCLVEEGLALRSLTSPTIYQGIGVAMGARLAGVNGVYLLLQLVNHAVWSIVVPVMITDLVLPAHRGRRYLRIPGLVIAPLVFLVGVALTAFAARTSIDPGYRMGGLAVMIILAMIAVLVMIALGPLGGRDAPHPPGVTGRALPRPSIVLVVSAMAGWGYLAPLWLPGHFRWGFARGVGIVPMIVLALAVAAGYLTLLLRRSWTPRHQAAAVTGLYLGHAAFGLLIQPDTWPDRAVTAALLIIAAVLLVRLIRKTAAINPAAGPGW